MADNSVGYGKPPKEHQWKPGESGNPAGYPAGVPNGVTLLRKVMAKEIDIVDPSTMQKSRVTIEEAIAYAIAAKASEGDVGAYKEIQDRLYGKVTDKVETTTVRKVTRKIGGRDPSEDGASGA